MSGKSKNQVSTVANNNAGTTKNDIKKASGENPALQASPFSPQPLSQAAEKKREPKPTPKTEEGEKAGIKADNNIT